MSSTTAGLSPSDKTVCLGKRSNILKLSVTPFPVKYFCNKHWEKRQGYPETMDEEEKIRNLRPKSLLIHPPLICCLIITKSQSLMCYKSGRRRKKYEGNKITNITWATAFLSEYVLHYHFLFSEHLNACHNFKQVFISFHFQKHFQMHYSTGCP